MFFFPVLDSDIVLIFSGSGIFYRVIYLMQSLVVEFDLIFKKKKKSHIWT